MCKLAQIVIPIVVAQKDVMRNNSIVTGAVTLIILVIIYTLNWITSVNDDEDDDDEDDDGPVPEKARNQQKEIVPNGGYLQISKVHTGMLSMLGNALMVALANLLLNTVAWGIIDSNSSLLVQLCMIFLIFFILFNIYHITRNAKNWQSER